MSTAQLLVQTVDLRKALRAVSAFVGKDTDGSEPWGRIRVLADEQVTYLSATTGTEAAVALVSTVALAVDDEATSEPLEFDITKADATKILTCFPGRDGKDGEPGDELRLDVDVDYLRVTDASGLFEGQTLQLGRCPDLEHPAQILRVIRSLACEEPTPPGDGVLAVAGPAFALLVAASKVYDRNVILELHQRGPKVVTLARIGESFLASISEAYIDEDAAATYDAYRGSWHERLLNLPAAMGLEVVR